MGKKKFIDKKKAATFCLLSRDSSDPLYAQGPENDRVFVRVDNNCVSIGGMSEDEFEGTNENDPSSVSGDGLNDVDYCDGFCGGSAYLSDNVRREILELGFPDDGYNYLTHLREIRNSGAGSAYYENSKANLRGVPDDVKAYDATRVQVAPVNEVTEDTSPKTLYRVAEKTVSVRVQKAVDPDIAKLLDEAESEIDSDVDDLEEDFIVKANILEETDDVMSEKSSASVSEPQDDIQKESHSVISHGLGDEVGATLVGNVGVSFTEKPRVQRLLDQQFDLLECREYGTDSDDDEYDGLIAKEGISCSEKLNNAKGRELDDLELGESYRTPADTSDGKDAAQIVRRCVEYAEKYEIEDDNEVAVIAESSDESKNFDCETIVSTYSNLDNHPVRINASDISRKKKLAETISRAFKTESSNVKSLGGKDRHPIAKIEPQKRESCGEETKEVKKERKAAVKEERREARRVKKEFKGVYRVEATRAQKVAADSGPSSIHLT
ncbi:hypothetical protein RND81_01G223700 [Saponaria officinalis]|uniref:Protein LTV1 homolog n=1 Tax=Saponaria officinalis TaxID=3572 RepID=A0AAW1NI31_SAPOF